MADRGQQPLRLDKFLSDHLAGISRNRISAAVRAGAVLVNDKPAKPSYKVKPADIVSVVLPHPKTDFEVLPEDIPLNIIYEDKEVLVLNKAPGMVVHPGHGNFNGTLVNALAHHLSALPGDPVRPGLVHRLDKDTTGLMVIAKTETAMSHLAKQFFERSVDRSYHTLVWGEPPGEEGSIEGHIGRNLRDRTLMAVFPDDTQGKPALTHFKVLERFGYVTLLECRLETGRTHQIRVHLRHIGHPVFGDVQYGGDRILKGTTFGKYTQFVKNCFKMLPRQALHARSIAFTHPASGKRMEFNSPLPDDMQGVLHMWRQYTTHRAVD